MTSGRSRLGEVRFGELSGYAEPRVCAKPRPGRDVSAEHVLIVDRAGTHDDYFSEQ